MITQLKWTTGSKIIPYTYFFQDQKIPKPKRLQDWYKRMLDKGIIERIVLDYKDIYKQALEDNLQSPAELPYFEGDFWSVSISFVNFFCLMQVFI